MKKKKEETRYGEFKVQIVIRCAVFSCPVLSDSLRPQGLQPTRLLCPWGFSRQEYQDGFSCPPPGDLPNPGIKPRSPAFQADSLLSESPGKPKNTRVSSLSFFQRIFPTWELYWGFPHCRWILYQLSYRESPYNYIGRKK